MDNYSGAAGANTNTNEVCGDIELQIALASGASKILVYEAPGQNQNVVDEYARIADDDSAKEISTSWGQPEVQDAEGQSVAYSGSSELLVRAEDSIFKQMASQGQSIFASSGDNGAYDAGTVNGLQVRDPAAQPYVCAVGGTTLAVQSTSGPWASESTWSGSGGGVSALWPIPAWQAQPNVAAPASNSSQNNNAFSYRNVPDVSLDSDPSTGSSIYYNGDWGRNPSNQYAAYGGTSFSAPLWAAYTALVNQQRAANGSGPIGFVNPYLYQLGTLQYLYLMGQSSIAVNDFHDITQGNNLYDNARTGYDDATGWGSFNGTNLLNDLVGEQSPPTLPLPFYRFTQPTYGACFNDSVDQAATLLDQGWNFNGVCGFVYSGSYDSPDLTPLYKMWRTQPYVDNLYTTSYSEYQTDTATGGYTGSGIECYVFPDGSQSGTVAMYRAFNSNGQHFMTTSLSQYQSWLQNGLSGENIKFYILAP